MSTANQLQTQSAALTPQIAVANISEAYPEEAKILSAVLKKDIVALGTDEAFALRDNDGEIKAFGQSLTLSEKAGTLVQPVPGGPWVISAQGYEVWQEAAGANVIFPSEVLVDGNWQANPAVIRDERNGRILMIYARAVAFRFSSKGIPMVTDITTIYDTPSYRMVDLLSKAKKTPQAFKLLPAEMNPSEKTAGTWAKYPFDEATNLWMNTSHDEALTWLGQIINREKKALDFAQTFARRNALKHLSGLQKAPGNTWTISVISWRPTNGNIIKWDATQYAALQAKVGGMISGDRSEFKQIEMQRARERVSDDIETAGLLEADMDPEDQVIDAGMSTEESMEQEPPVIEKEPPALSEEDQRVLANLKVAAQTFNKEFLQACKNLQLKIQDPASYNPGTAAEIMKQINNILDAENAG